MIMTKKNKRPSYERRRSEDPILGVVLEMQIYI
jgi:hypothetical protein